jgi:RNA polymerase sigma factor (sigma-70 family)
VTDDSRPAQPRDGGDAIPRLVRDAATGDAAAWQRLYPVVARWVAAVGGSLGLGREDVADVNQIVCLRLLSHLHRLRAPEALRGWVVTVARHESYRVLRDRLRRAADLDTLPETTSALADPWSPPVDERLLRSERQRELHRAMCQLSADCQRLLRLLATDPPLSYADAAAVLDRPIGAIGPTRQRCLARLRALLEDVTVSADESTVSDIDHAGTERLAGRVGRRGGSR